MRKLPAIAVILLTACAAALADGDEKPFLQLAKGNFWQYEVVEGEEKVTGKIEVEEIDKDGKFKLKLSDMGARSPESVTWRIEKEYIVWEYMPGLDWKVLKFGAKKDDTWSSKPGDEAPEKSRELQSKVVAVEDIETPAGKFEGCIKVETRGAEAVVNMWWAGGVGIVKLEDARGGKTRTSWTLTSFKAGPDISDEKLKEMVEKADVVAQVSVPKEGAGSKKVNAKLGCSFKGDTKAEDGRIKITQPREGATVKPFEQGDFVVFLKKEGETLVMLYGAVESDKQILDRITRIVTPPGRSLEKLKELAGKAEIIVGVEIVVLEDRVSFKYYVGKIIAAAKGASRRKYLDVLCLPGMKLDKGKKYILFLVNTEEAGRKLAKPVDTVKGILDYDEGLLNRLAEIAQASK